jgi:hypothetical protein
VPVYEANAWFKGVADRPDDTETLDEMRELFVRTNIVDDISWYLMYEAADTVLRMQNCRFAVDGVLLNMMPEFFTATSQLQKFNKLFSDQPIEKSHLMLSVPFESLKGYNKTTLDIIKRYLKNGINIVPDGVNQDERFTPEFLKEMGFTTVVLDSKLYKSIEGAVLVNDLRKNGITVYGKNADSNEILKWINSNHIYCYSGTMVGIPTSEDEMILNILAREEM